MLTVHRQVELRDPVLLCAFTGWSDAASAASGALSYLLMKWPGEELASFDPEVIYNYTVTRPVVRMSAAGRRELQWPALTWTALPLPHAPHDLVVLVGPEPDLQWPSCARAAVEYAQRLGVTRVLGLGCFYAPVLHSAPVPMVGTATDRALRDAVQALGLHETGYQGPTGFLTTILDAAHRLGVPGAGVWGAAPNYLPGMPNARVSSALLGTIERLLHFELGREELETTARDLDSRIETALRERPDLRAVVEKIQSGEVDEDDDEPAVEEEPEELPDSRAVLEDLEQYLRGLQERPEDS